VTERTKITLDESEVPRQWYNVIPHLPSPPPPPLHPGTGQPVGPGDLAPLFPMRPGLVTRDGVAGCGCG
jgi:tryptophan synthase beta chain